MRLYFLQCCAIYFSTKCSTFYLYSMHLSEIKYITQDKETYVVNRTVKLIKVHYSAVQKVKCSAAHCTCIMTRGGIYGEI